MKGRSFSKILAFILLALAAVMVLVSLRAIRPPETLVLKPKSNIQAYRLVTLDDFEQVRVPKTDTSVTENDLTADWLAEQIEDDKPVFFTQNLLMGQRLDKRHVGSDPQGSLSIVSPDERLIIVSGTAAGTLGGLLQPGSVVTVRGNDGEVSSDFGKVIAFGVGGDVGSSAVVRDSGADAGNGQAEGQGGQVLVLLAVADSDAAELAGKDVTLTLNPHCRITNEGRFEAVHESLASQCRPTGRAASAAAEPSDAPEDGDEPAAEGDPAAAAESADEDDAPDTDTE